MSGLQTAYYIVALVFMGVIFIILLSLLAIGLVIRSKINAIHARIEERLEQATGLAEKGAAVIGTIKKAAKNK